MKYRPRQQGCECAVSHVCHKVQFYCSFIPCSTLQLQVASRHVRLALNAPTVFLEAVTSECVGSVADGVLV